MEVDKKILIKLLKVLEELKNSIKDTSTLDVDNKIDESF